MPNFFNKLRNRTTGESGFTLVELLVVMLILGLLAGIGIPAFLSQRDKAVDAEAKSAAGTAGKAAETVAVANEGVYNGPDGVTVASLRAVEPTLTESNLEVISATANGYTIRVTASTGHTFDYIRAAGIVTTDCSPHGEGACPQGGSWN